MPEEKSELSKILLSILDKYERDSDDYECIRVVADQENDRFSYETQGQVDDARKATGAELESRIFDNAERTDSEFSALLMKKQPITRSVSVEEIRKGMEKAKESRATRDSDTEDTSEEDEERLLPAHSNDLHLYFAKEFAANLDRIVSGVERLEEVGFYDSLSPDLKLLLREAHRCYLYGFENAAIIMCGAILEQALKNLLRWKELEPTLTRDELKQGVLRLLLKKAEDRKLLTHSQRRMGDEIRQLRNDAIHNRAQFHKRSAPLRATVISNTREILRMLLSGKIESKDT